jgi:AcrR family transcriptional regulator
VRVFAEKGYHAATLRDIVAAADVAIGTFYFYFPDKETLFVYLYEETAEFLLQTIRQALSGRATLAKQITSVGASPPLIQKRAEFREALVSAWLQPLEVALEKGQIAPQNTRRTAEALAGAFDEIVLNLLALRDPQSQASSAIADMANFALRAVAYLG